MENPLFRKKSLDHISSPEELHDYMRVTSPRLWMVLAAIIILLAGFAVYASTATLENTMPIRVQVENYELPGDSTESGTPEHVTLIRAVLPMDQQDIVRTGMKVRIGKEEGSVSWITIMDDEVDLIIEADSKNTMIPDGEHDAVLVVESTTPISFLWN